MAARCKSAVVALRTAAWSRSNTMSLPVRLMRLTLLPMFLLCDSDHPQPRPQLPNGEVRLRKRICTNRSFL